MSALKGHRVLIANLFLPVTVTNDDRDSPKAIRPPPPPTLPGKPKLRNLPIKSIVDDLADKKRLGSPLHTPLPDPNKAQNPFATLGQSLGNAVTGNVGGGTPSHVPTFSLDAVASSLKSVAETVTTAVLPPRGDNREQDSAISTTPDRANSSSKLGDYNPATAGAGGESRPRARRLSRKGSRSSSKVRNNSINTGSAIYSDSKFTISANVHGNGGLYNAVAATTSPNRMTITPNNPYAQHVSRRGSVQMPSIDVQWIGTLAQLTDGFNTIQRKEIDKRLETEQDCRVVWCSDEVFTKAYDGFCHQVLWPTLHYLPDSTSKSSQSYGSSGFEHYKTLNQKFAELIEETYEDGDIIWINDYHLMLLPQMVRERLPNAPIGFFMHVAFPSSEIFRCLSVRNELLRGLLSVDLMGFQTANFARHFRQTVSRLLSVETLPKGIQLEDTFVDVGVFPMGIDVRALAAKRKDPEVIEWVEVLYQRYSGMKLVVGRDKMDEIQGVKYKLLAFEMFLERRPEWRGKVILIQVALTTSEDPETYGGTVTDLVSRINSKFSNLTYQPVVFLHTNDLTFNQYLALLTVADVFLVTSLREGMALRTHEYVECQEGKKKKGVLILSEFTGSYSYSGFRSCIPINPWDSRATSEAINQALSMDENEANSRWKDLHNHVITQTGQAFVSAFLNRCIRVYNEHQRGSTTLSIPVFALEQILPRYRHSNRRLLLLDYEDTLWLRQAHERVSAHEPPSDVVDLLKALASDEKNAVWLLSGLPIDGALTKIAENVPELGICAENGCFIKTPGQASQWLSLISNFNMTWKPICLELLQYFQERTPGSYIEERGASVVFRYFGRDAKREGHDWEWARRQAAEAQNHIWDSLGERFGLRIVPGKTSFLIMPNNISRSSAVGSILRPDANPAGLMPRASSMAFIDEDYGSPSTPGYVRGPTASIDFVLAIGSDQKLLRRLGEMEAGGELDALSTQGFLGGGNGVVGGAETVTTGAIMSDAKWRLEKEDVMGVLKQLVDQVAY